MGKRKTLKTVKRLMRKAYKTGSDPWLALHAGGWPSGILQQRRLKVVHHNTCSAAEQERCSQQWQLSFSHRWEKKIIREYTTEIKRGSCVYNRHTKPLTELKVGITVWVQPIRKGSSEWVKATVKKVVPCGSFVIQIENGREARRTRRHLKVTAEPLTPHLQSPSLVLPTQQVRRHEPSARPPKSIPEPPVQ